jgi:hypothetical protein
MTYGKSHNQLKAAAAAAIVLALCSFSSLASRTEPLDTRLMQIETQSKPVNEKPIVLAFGSGGSGYNYDFYIAIRVANSNHYVYERNLRTWINFSQTDFNARFNVAVSATPLVLTKYYREFSGQAHTYTFTGDVTYTASPSAGDPTKNDYNYVDRQCTINSTGGLSATDRHTITGGSESAFTAMTIAALTYPPSGSESTLLINQSAECRAGASYFSASRLHRLEYVHRRLMSVYRNVGLERAGASCDTSLVYTTNDFANNSTSNSRSYNVNLPGTCIASVDYAEALFNSKMYGISNSDTSSPATMLYYYNAAGQVVLAPGAAASSALDTPASRTYYASKEDHSYFVWFSNNLYFIDVVNGEFPLIVSGTSTTITNIMTGLTLK